MRCVIFRLSSSHPGLLINAFLSDFKFPYDTADENERTTAKPAGHGQPKDPLNYPMDHPDWPKLLDAEPPIL